MNFSFGKMNDRESVRSINGIALPEPDLIVLACNLYVEEAACVIVK